MISTLVSLGAVVMAQSPDAAASSDWRAAASLESPRAGVAATVSDDLIYAAGGSGLLAPIEDFDEYDPAADSWRGLQPLPMALERMGLAALDGRIYVAGGYTKDSPTDPIDDVWIYDPSEETWTDSPAMPAARANFTLVETGGKLYAVGGSGEGAGVVSVYDPAKNGWREAGEEPVADRRGAAAVALNGDIYVIGGVGESGGLSRVDIFDAENETWREGPALPGARYGHAAAIVGGRIHVAGGRASSDATLRDHLILDAATGQWAEGAPLPTPRSAAAGAAHDGEFYVIGGGAGGGFFAPFTAIDSVDVFKSGD